MCLSLPGNEANQTLRVPLAAVTKRHLYTEQSFDEIQEVVAWSFRCLAEGRYPATRHDGSPFMSAASDSRRSRSAGKELGIKGLLVELRGDWLMCKKTLRFAGWQEKHCCCH